MSTGRSSIGGSIRILTVDDHALLRQGIAALIKTQPDMQLVAGGVGREEATAQFRAHRPMSPYGSEMPNVNGTEAISRIRANFPMRRSSLSTYAGDVQVLRAIKAGARGYLLKEMSAQNCWRLSASPRRAQANTARNRGETG